ncbi:ROK family protein [Streptomyces sp. NPDC091377]|uniref:ROK family transcriptional regulator n=1 Tax=Streptomyces sp. NPDC091377 TaxID=3365995 RepID=UPI003824D897
MGDEANGGSGGVAPDRGTGFRARAGGAGPLAPRSHSTALVLDLLRTAGTDGMTRIKLAERTGLTPQAVSKITARLRADGLATEAGHRRSTGGKPRTVLRLVPGAGHAVGAHLERDALRAVLVDLTGTVVRETSRPLALTAGTGAEAVPAAVEAAVAEVAEAAGAARTLLGVGVALPGPLDHRRGVLHRVTGFPEWDGFPLRDALGERLGLPVVVDKDTNAAALRLAVGGTAPAFVPRSSFAYLHLGTGLGAGLVLDGAVHRGARTGAGEFGHQVVQLDGPECSCGNRGCVEALCLAAVRRGDLGEAARVLGVGAANLVALLDIDLVLLGGRTVTAAPEVFVRGVTEVLDARARREGGGDPRHAHGQGIGQGQGRGRGRGLGFGSGSGAGSGLSPEGGVPVRIASGGERGVAEGAAQLVLGPLFGHGQAHG